jgi:ribosomal protein L37E
MQKAKSLDFTVDYENICSKCGIRGVIYGKEKCHSCYFGFEKEEKYSDILQQSENSLESNSKRPIEKLREAKRRWLLNELH